jgi:sarcosine oxidase
MESFSHIVIGAGAIGTGAAYWLAERGADNVMLLEQFEIGHTKGASEDHSRIIRHAYHSSAYTALTTVNYETWARIEEETGLQLVVKTGGLDLAETGTPGADELDHYRSALAASGIPYSDLTVEDVRARWPQFRIPDSTVGMFQEEGGILDIRKANAAHLARARQMGVEVRPHTRVLQLRDVPGGVEIETDRGTYRAEAVVLCTASWSEHLLRPLGIDWSLTLSQEQVSYFATPNLRDFAPDRFPMWIWHGERLFYGFPVYGEVAVKLGRDMTGRFVTQETRSFDPDPDETQLLEDFLRERIPGAVGPELYSRTCIYDMPVDRDFILDKLPGHPNITVGLGAGHAAKFGSLLGQILADLTLSGTTKHPIDAFRADRPALTDPDFEPVFRMTGPSAD